MKLSKSLLVIPAASILLAAAIGAGACSSSVSITIPTGSPPPSGVTFVGGSFGGTCVGDIYAVAGDGWAFCDDGVWDYTTSDPDDDGYTLDSAGDDTSGDDTSADDTSGSDDTSADDTSGSDDTSADDTTSGSDDTSGDDTTSSAGDDTSGDDTSTSAAGDDTSSSS